MKSIAAIYRNKYARYVFSGGTAAAVNLGLIYLIVGVLHEWYLVGTIAAFAGAFCVSFVMQKFLTFNDRSLERVRAQAAGYLLIAVVNLGINTLVMYIAVDWCGLHYLLAQFLVTASIALYSFVLYKQLIFTGQELS